MERYEVFVSDLWPGPLKESDFDLNKYKKNVRTEDKISLNVGCFLILLAELLWLPLGIGISRTFGSYNWMYAGLFFIPIFMISIAININKKKLFKSLITLNNQQ